MRRAEERLHARVKAAIEVEEEVRFWGSAYRITPLVVPAVFGDGRALFHITPLLTRPNFFVVRGDSSWLNVWPGSSWATIHDHAIHDVLDEGDWRVVDPEYEHMGCAGGGIFEAIEEAFGRWRDPEDREPDDPDDDYYSWPNVDLGFGVAWGCVRLGAEHSWGRIPAEWVQAAAAGAESL